MVNVRVVVLCNICRRPLEVEKSKTVRLSVFQMRIKCRRPTVSRTLRDVHEDRSKFHIIFTIFISL